MTNSRFPDQHGDIIPADVKRSTANLVLFLLTTINFVNYVDRFVINGMYETLHRDFGINETHYGLLTTITFGVHAATTIPFGWLADRYDRRKIVAVAVVAWSLATLACAVVTQYWLLAVLRGFVGLAEAAYGPVAVAILCEIFPEDEKARTVGIYNVGMFLGTTAGLILGGRTDRFHAFTIVGAPGILLGLLALWMPVENTRASRSSLVPYTPSPAAVSGSDAPPSPSPLSLGFVGLVKQITRDVARLLSSRTLAWMMLGGILVSFSAGGYITFVNQFVVKYKHMSAEQATLRLGIVVLTAGPIGLLLGGWLADRMQQRTQRGRLLVVALGFLLCSPFGLLIVYVDTTLPFLIFAWFVIFFMVWYNGPISAVIDDVVDPREASSAQATFNFVIHLFGTAPAGVVIGLLAEKTKSRHAFITPSIAALAGVAFFLIACRFVGAEMNARNERLAQRQARKAAAAATEPPAR